MLYYVPILLFSVQQNISFSYISEFESGVRTFRLLAVLVPVLFLINTEIYIGTYLKNIFFFKVKNE